MEKEIRNISREVLESINFENPSQVDADKLYHILWNEANACPTYTGFFRSNNDQLLAYNWRIMISGGSPVLAYSYMRSRPFKKRVESSSYVIEFVSADRFLACRPGGRVIYEYEEPSIWEQAINPIKQALGFEYNCDGECLRPGTKSGWRD